MSTLVFWCGSIHISLPSKRLDVRGDNSSVDFDDAKRYYFDDTIIQAPPEYFSVDFSLNRRQVCKSSKVQMWLHISRTDYENGYRLYYPLLASLSEGFKSAGMTVSVLDVRHNHALLEQIKGNADKQHWVVSLGVILGFSMGSASNAFPTNATIATLKDASALGARVVLYQSEPQEETLGNVDRVVQMTSATEVWDYSHRNLALYETQAIKRFMPPGYVQALDFGIETNASKYTTDKIAFLGNWKHRSPLLRMALHKILGSALHRQDGVWSRQDFQSYLTKYPMQLNIHLEHSASSTHHGEHMEALRMALLLSNKACIISTPVDLADRTPWESMVYFVEMENIATMFESLLQDLQKCRMRGYNTFKSNFTMTRIIENSGVLHEVKH
eukprot:gnl/TRDRNA2_/TRDRNA2_66200_c0_seq1.p1 gnl/TRDRNA2_/TRDRNA2_66200_c0~~gnl/TRDRNA2_/TRDRNA2_66200_c0_seq1.p1  ORF type:complete len:401 (-),score=36.23 gnl/TRDRNA2_/TRDRNA2_66200_c0_seq1:112-1269(-)